MHSSASKLWKSAPHFKVALNLVCLLVCYTAMSHESSSVQVWLPRSALVWSVEWRIYSMGWAQWRRVVNGFSEWYHMTYTRPCRIRTYGCVPSLRSVGRSVEWTKHMILQEWCLLYTKLACWIILLFLFLFFKVYILLCLQTATTATGLFSSPFRYQRISTVIWTQNSLKTSWSPTHHMWTSPP